MSSGRVAWTTSWSPRPASHKTHRSSSVILGLHSFVKQHVHAHFSYTCFKVDFLQEDLDITEPSDTALPFIRAKYVTDKL